MIKKEFNKELSYQIIRADKGTRTPDPRITNALLYQLSHIGKTDCKGNSFFEIREIIPFFFV